MPASFAQHPLADRYDQAAFLGNLDKLGRQNHPLVRILPTQKRFGAGNFTADKINFWLIVQQKFSVFQGPAQASFDSHPLNGMRIHFRSEKLEIIPPVCLCVIHRRIGVLDDGSHVVSIIRIDADAYAQ